MRFTTFSCLSSWRILISRKAVMGNWKEERGQGLGVQETRPPLPREQERCDHSSLAWDLLEQHCDKSLKGNQSFKIKHQHWDCQNLFTIRPPLVREIVPQNGSVCVVPRWAHRNPSLLPSPRMFITGHGTAQLELQSKLPSCCPCCLRALSPGCPISAHP